jgi:hypothetical protein
MKFSTTPFTCLLALLPGLVLAQGNPAVKAPAKLPGASVPTGFSREKATDICTTAPRDEWLSQDEMKLLAEHRGYRIKTFKLAKGDCYEIYGFDREGRIVEAYFNPATSRLVRQNIAK